MPQADDDSGEHTTFIRREDTLRVIEDEFGHYLVVISGPSLGQRLLLDTKGVVIGRDSQTDLVLASAEVSRRHCRVDLTGSELIVTDLNSTNGTYVDGRRIRAPAPLPDGSILTIGQQVIKHERRSRREVQEAQDLDRDLEKARNYVLALLPAPITEASPRTEWLLVPSAKVGGDAFGYGDLDGGKFMMFLFDVSGHGIGAAMLTVSILNVLRQRALLSCDFGSPAEVLSRLNVMFQMENHDGMFFTIWYGVYDKGQRTLIYASAGHHPAYLVSEDRKDVAALKTDCVMIGALENLAPKEASVPVPDGATLHLFSDGVFEIEDSHGGQLGLENLLPLLRQPPAEKRSEPQRIYRIVREFARSGPMDDDFSYLTVKFA
ncbi:MAG TPA: SpoIIE family protein phosphatase [Micropepsaceae bacterium]|nr:SpoIIE family protein phosphatase [Micropepsaceae bacterium]